MREKPKSPFLNKKTTNKLIKGSDNMARRLFNKDLYEMERKSELENFMIGLGFNPKVYKLLEKRADYIKVQNLNSGLVGCERY